MVLSSVINNDFYNWMEDDYFKHHSYIKEDGKYILSFCGVDSEELFEQNLKTKTENWYYRTNPVKYTLNSYGYRTEEFDNIDWKNSIVMFGCSFVFGTGVTDEHTISYFLEKISGRPVVNLGIAGSSIQTTLHNGIILNDSKYPTPKAIVPLWTSMSRHQIYFKEVIKHCGIWNRGESPFESYRYHIITQNLMNIKMFRNLWKNKTIYSEFTLFTEHKRLINRLDNNIVCQALYYKNSTSSRARDCSHLGKLDNLKIAKEIYQRIKFQLDP